MAIPVGEDGIPAMSSEELAQRPVSVVDDARRQAPVLRTQPERLLALRAEDVRRLFTDSRLVQTPGDQFAEASGIPPGRCRSFLESVMLFTNGETHRHLRGAFVRTFAHPVIRARRGQVRAVADAIVADLPRGADFDFLSLCASRLPSEMIATVLGLPLEDSAWFSARVYSLSRCLTIPYVDHDEIEAAAEALYHFVSKALDDRRATPRDDLLSMLVTDDPARALGPEELIYQVMGLILAGSDTTRTGFNMAVGRLLSDRALWEEVRADRALIPAAIDEALRTEPPIGAVGRYVVAPIEFGDITVGPGQLLGLSTLSAMRDETCIAAPDRFDLHRQDHIQPHPVFGGGPHRCLGEMLARIELEEGLAALLDGAPDIRLVEAPRLPRVAGIRQSTPMIAHIP